MPKKKHDCAYCNELFDTTTEHMDHVMRVHSPSFRPKGQRLLRQVSCWSCAKDMPRGLLECECGFVLPSNWVNGQLLPEGYEPEIRSTD